MNSVHLHFGRVDSYLQLNYCQLFVYKRETKMKQATYVTYRHTATACQVCRPSGAVVELQCPDFSPAAGKKQSQVART